MTTHHAFSIEHARLYGMREAVLIRNLHFWVSHNHANGTHQHDGRTWTYNSVRAFEDLFPYLTYKQIRTSLENAVDVMKNQEANLKLATEVARVSKIKFQEGVGSNLEVITAETDLRAAQTNYYSALYDALIAKVDLDKAQGSLKK